ncbi:branched-chain amino acid ABC transporter substrate-binding protein [Nocardioides sp. MH1]|uniref:branched-chain amino acid ABC transporter substrate-binding protein n=1 Tax=Nocardioides sp. MH1 TaxID=3242490 RepID=UPI003521546A
MGERGAHQVAIVDDNTSYSVDIAERTRDLVEADGVSTSSTSVTAGESDYSSAVSDVLSEDPDLVYWTGYFQEGGLLVNQLRRAGYDGDVMIADGSVDPSFVKIAGDDNAEGVFATMTQTPDTIEGAEDWIASYRDEFDSEPGPYSTQSYDAVRVAVAAIKDAGSTDGDDVIAALEDLDGFEIFSGPLHFTEEHTLSEGGFQVLVVKHGKFVLEDPLR